MKLPALAILFVSMFTTSAMPALIPPCGEALPARWVASDHTEQGSSLEYLETMVRIEIEGEALATRVSRGVDKSVVTNPECRSTAVPILALGRQPD